MQMHKIVVDQYENNMDEDGSTWRWTIWEDEGNSYTSECYYASPEIALSAAMLEVTSTRARAEARYDALMAIEKYAKIQTTGNL